MENYAIVLTLIMVFVYSESKSSTEDSLNFKLAQDTVMIDPVGSIINFRPGLTSPEVTKDGKYLYLYTYGETKFQKVNLEDLVLEETLQFEKEGPDGMGTNIGGFALNSANQIMIWSFSLNAIFDRMGKKVRDLRLTKIASELGGGQAFPIRLMEHPNDPEMIYGLYVMTKDDRFFLFKFDIKNGIYKKISLPETEKLHEDRMVIYQGGSPRGAFGPMPMATNVQNKIVVTNNAYNEAYVYDILLDSLYFKSWNSDLTGYQNEYKLPEKVEQESSAEHRKKYMEAINFLEPKWDYVSERFIRLSYKTKFGEDRNRFGDALEIGADVYLTVLDKDLNIVKETFLDNYKKTPTAHFFKDNKIWLYENMDDELGFVRITVD